jgi:hypothetical protein
VNRSTLRRRSSRHAAVLSGGMSLVLVLALGAAASADAAAAASRDRPHRGSGWHLGEGEGGSRGAQRRRSCRAHLGVVRLGGQLQRRGLLRRQVQAIGGFVVNEVDGTWGAPLQSIAA